MGSFDDEVPDEFDELGESLEADEFAFDKSDEQFL